jgi:hypothetical protein
MGLVHDGLASAPDDGKGNDREKDHRQEIGHGRHPGDGLARPGVAREDQEQPKDERQIADLRQPEMD